MATLVVNVSTNDGVDPEGAIINLNATIPDPAGSYPSYQDTVSNGQISLNNVYKTAYNLTATYPGYETLTMEIVVDEDLETVDALITEIRYMPSNAGAEVTVLDEEVTINWNAPVTPQRVRIGYNLYRVPWANQNDELETDWVQVNDVTITDTAFVDTDWTNVETGSFVYAVKAVYTQMVESDPIFSNYVEKNMQSEVTVTVLTNDGSIPEGGDVSFTATIPDPAGQIAQSSGTIGADGTVTIADVYKTEYNMTVTYEGFATLTTPVSVADDTEEFEVTIIELLLPVTNVVASSNNDDTVLTLTWESPVSRSADRQLRSARSRSNGFASKENNLSTFANSSNSLSSLNSRYIETYTIFRFLLEDQANTDMWDSLATVSEMTYIDNDWGTIDEDIYKYAVIANYTGENQSPAALSNWVGQGLFTTLTVNVQSYFEDPLEGVTVQLIGLTPDPQGQTNDYSIVTNAEGVSYFPAVWRGNYTINVTKEGFVPFTLETVSIQVPSEVTYQISEPLNPIVELSGEAISNNVYLDWSAPSAINQYDFEASNGGFTADAGWEWGTTDSLGAHSGDNVWATTPNEYYDNSADYSLLSPEFTVQAGMNLEFYVNYHTEENADGLNCKISTDEGLTWDLIEPIGGYSSVEDGGENAFGGDSEGWILATFDLSAYNGNTAQIKWHFQSSSSVNNFNGVAIDDVYLGYDLMRPLAIQPQRAFGNSKKAMTNNSSTRNNERTLEGYNIYRNGETEPYATVTTTDFADEELENGDYTYTVTALYTTGESIPDTISFAIYPVSVSTTVFGSDAPTTGMEDVYGTLYNDTFSYEALSVGGEIEFADIQGNETYNMVLYKPGYEIYRHEDEIIVELADIDIEDVMLNEKANPPDSVFVEFNEIETEATISWGDPVTDTDAFRHDDGNIQNQMGFGANPNTVFGAIHRNTAIVNQIDWYLSSEIAQHQEVKLFIFALDVDGNATNEVLYESSLISNIDDEWNSYLMDQVVVAENGFLVGISTPNQFTGIGYDDGEDFPYEFEAGTQLLINDYITGEWEDLSNYEVTGNLAIRAFGINDGTIEYLEERIARKDVSEKAVNQTSREFESYNVYLLNTFNDDNPSTWDLIAENVVDTTVVDLRWFEATPGTYYYAVRSNHTNGVQSNARFSESLEKGAVQEYNLDFTVDLGGAPADGAEITLINQNGLEEYTYDQIVTNGEAEIEDVAIGFYALTVELEGTPTYNDTLLIDQNMNIEIILVDNNNDASEVYNTSLIGNYPNPFNPTTNISFSLANDSAVKIDVYNIKGQLIKTVANAEYEAGLHKITWNGKDTNGKKVSSGMYFYKLSTNNYTRVKKMLMLK
jgi:hypothetical protein